jgi:hypothetical protein
VQTTSDLPLPPHGPQKSTLETPAEGHTLYGVTYDISAAADAAPTAASGSDIANFAPKAAATPID